MKDQVKIANSPVLITCSQPYVLGKGQPYKVNKIVDGKKSAKVVLQFKNKKEGDEFYNKNNNKYQIDFVDLDGNEVGEPILFDTEEEANEHYRQNLLKNKEILKSDEEESDEEIIKQLEANFHALPATLEEDEEEIENQERLAERRQRRADAKEAEAVYQLAVTDALTHAKELLNSVAELYLDKNIIDRYPYIKKRLYYEEQSISNITLQIMISNNVLKKFYREILKFPSAKNIETLSKLQKTILDISKYQREYLGEIEASFKKLKEDNDTNKFVLPEAEEIVAEEITEEDGLIKTNSRQALIDEIRSINSEAKTAKIPMSPNANLQTDDENVEDNFNIYEGDDYNDSNDDYKVSGTGLESNLE